MKYLTPALAFCFPLRTPNRYRLSSTTDPLRAEARLRAAAFVIGLGVVAIFFVNNVLGSIDFSANQWTFPVLLPVQQPPGSDFHVGIYVPAELVRYGHSPYEIFNCYLPFVSVFGLPYTLLMPRQAYLVHLVLLIAANVLVLRLTVDLARRAFGSTRPSHVSFATVLMLLLMFTQFTSYGLLLSLERGNTDIFVILLSLSVLWLVIHRPPTLITQVVLLSIAVHLKIYPAILFVLLFRRHGYRCILPALVCNLAMLFVLGYKQLPDAIAAVKIATSFNLYLVLNHSVNSFVATVIAPNWNVSSKAALALSMLPVLIWAIGALVLWRRPFSTQNAVLLFALSVPVMNLVTNISYDYKLVITFVPIGMLLYASAIRFATDGSVLAALAGCVLLVMAGVISRSYVLTQSRWIANKCPTLCLLELLVLAAILVPGLASAREHLELGHTADA